jgi:hypothetical protein
MTKKTTLPAVKEAAGLPADWAKIMAEKASRARAAASNMQIGGGGKGLSFRGGVMSLGGVDIGHETDVLIVGYVPERQYFTGDYDASNTTAPNCYSFDGVAPHPSVAQPLHETCKGCPMDEFGSARVGKGKACKEGRRLAIIPADKEPASDAQLYTARVSTMNVPAFDAYETVLESAGKTVFESITKLTCHADKGTQYKLGFSWLRKFLPRDPRGYLALLGRAEQELVKPYPAPKADAPPVVKGPLRKSRM